MSKSVFPPFSPISINKPTNPPDTLVKSGVNIPEFGSGFHNVICIEGCAAIAGFTVAALYAKVYPGGTTNIPEFPDMGSVEHPDPKADFRFDSVPIPAGGATYIAVVWAMFTASSSSSSSSSGSGTTTFETCKISQPFTAAMPGLNTDCSASSSSSSSSHV